MTDFQFRLWIYLITYVDDYGRGSADPELLKGFVFPRLKRHRESDIEKALTELADLGSLHLYTVDGEPFLCLPNWGAHQRIQTKRSKFPAPPEINSNSQETTADNSNSQSFTVINGNPPLSTVTHGESPPESNPNPNTNPNTKGSKDYCSELPSDDGPPNQNPPLSTVTHGDQPIITLTLNDKSEYPIYEEQCQEWAGLYPAVDVIQQLRHMRGWLTSNPSKRKTKRGILGFINTWLRKEQDKPNQNNRTTAGAFGTPIRGRTADEKYGDSERFFEGEKRGTDL